VGVPDTGTEAHSLSPYLSRTHQGVFVELNPGRAGGKRVPHIAFEVDDLDRELSRLNFIILTPPNSLGAGIRVAMIEHNGAPMNLLNLNKGGA